MSESDLYTALQDLTDALSKAKVHYFIGGSIASSLHGEFRATNDIDTICEFDDCNVDVFISAARAKFIIDEAALRQAVKRAATYNIIHESSLTKVVLSSSTGEFRQQELARASFFDLPGSTIQMRVASAEDVILSKLVWYRKGNDASDRQWRDILGVLKTRANTLDLSYLKKTAEQLNVSDLLDRVLVV